MSEQVQQEQQRQRQKQPPVVTNDTLSVFGCRLDPTERCLLVIFTSVEKSNPNGHIDDNGRPKVLPDGHGEMTRGSQLAKLEEYLMQVYGENMYITQGRDLKVAQEPYAAQVTKGNRKSAEAAAQRFAADHFDARVTGATLTQFDGAKIRGAWQPGDWRSVHPVIPVEWALSRRGGGLKEEKGKGRKVEEDIDALIASVGTEPGVEAEAETQKKLRGNMGRKTYIEYGLYRTDAEFLPHAAAFNGVTGRDMVLWTEGIVEGNPRFRAANRTGVDVRRMYLIKIGSERGVSMPRLKESIQAVCPSGAPTCFADYTFSVDLDLIRRVARGIQIQVYEWADHESKLLLDTAKL